MAAVLREGGLVAITAIYCLAPAGGQGAVGRGGATLGVPQTVVRIGEVSAKPRMPMALAQQAATGMFST